MAAPLTVRGDTEVIRALDDLAHEIAEQRGGLDDVAREAETVVRDRAPRGETGLLAADVRGERVGQSAVVTVGRRAFYAGFVNYGTSRMPARPFMQAADPILERRAVQLLETNTDRLIKAKGLNR